MNPIAAIGEVAGVAGKAIDLAKVREARANAPEMVDNANAATNAAIKADARDAIAKGDIDKIRKLAAE